MANSCPMGTACLVNLLSRPSHLKYQVSEVGGVRRRLIHSVRRQLEAYVRTVVN